MLSIDSVVNSLWRWLPTILASLFMSFYNPSPWVWPGPRDLIPINGIQQRQWDVTSMIKLQRTVASILLAGVLYCLLGLCSLMKEDAVLMRSLWQSQTNKQQYTETFSPSTLEELIPANNHVSNIGNSSILVKPLCKTAALADILTACSFVREAEDRPKLCWESWLWGNKWVLRQ